MKHSNIIQDFSDFLDKKTCGGNVYWIANDIVISPGKIKDLFEEFINQ